MFWITNRKKNKVAGTICFEVRVPRNSLLIFFYIIFQNLMFDVGLLFEMLDLSSFDQSCHFVLQLSHRCPVTSVFELSIESLRLKSMMCPNKEKLKQRPLKFLLPFPGVMEISTFYFFQRITKEHTSWIELGDFTQSQSLDIFKTQNATFLVEFKYWLLLWLQNIGIHKCWQ